MLTMVVALGVTGDCNGGQSVCLTLALPNHDDGAWDIVDWDICQDSFIRFAWTGGATELEDGGH